MAVELFANQPFTTVTSGGTTATSGSQTWTVASAAQFPVAVSGISQFHIADVASAASSEIITVTNVGGTPATTWIVTRGAEGSTPVAHQPGFTITQILTAGILRTVLTNETDWINVTSPPYNADPTGNADASAAFSSAFTAGQNVYAPAGTFLVNSGISVPANSTLRGAGITATVLKCATSGINVVGVNGTASTFEVEYPVVESLAILGPGTGAGYGLYVSWSTAVSAFRDISVSAAGSHGVYVTNTYNAVFDNVAVSGSGGDGFHAVSNVNACTFRDCLSSGNTAGAGFSLNGGAGTQFLGCTSESNHGHGFSLTSTFGGGIYGGDSESNGADGTSANIYVGSGCSAAQIRGVPVNGGTITSVNIEDDGGTDTFISGNVFSPPASAGTDIKLTSNAVRPRLASNTAIGGSHSSLVIADASGTGVYDTGANIASLLSGPATPSDNGYICQNFDPATAPVNVSSGMVNYTAGQVFLSRIDLRQAIVSGKKLYTWWVQGAGGTISNLNCYIAAFNSSGTQLGSTSADLHSTASGLQSVTLPALPPQSIYGAVMIGTQQSGTGLTNAAGLMYATGAIGLVSSTFAAGDGLAAAAYRSAHQLTGQTSMPGSLTMSSNVTSVPYFWLAIGS